MRGRRILLDLFILDLISNVLPYCTASLHDDDDDVYCYSSGETRLRAVVFTSWQTRCPGSQTLYGIVMGGGGCLLALWTSRKAIRGAYHVQIAVRTPSLSFLTMHGWIGTY